MHIVFLLIGAQYFRDKQSDAGCETAAFCLVRSKRLISVVVIFSRGGTQIAKCEHLARHVLGCIQCDHLGQLLRSHDDWLVHCDQRDVIANGARHSTAIQVLTAFTFGQALLEGLRLDGHILLDFERGLLLLFELLGCGCFSGFGDLLGFLVDRELHLRQVLLLL